MPRLVIRSGPLANQEFPLNPGTNHIGRAEGNEVCLDDASVSHSHCSIVVGDEAFTIIDLNSTNGTAVNGDPIQSARLKSGDAVRLGSLECVFVADTPVVPVTTLARARPTAAPIKVVVGGAPPEPPRIAPPLPPPITASGIPESGWCRNHPHNPARYYCKPCAKAFCELCVAVRRTGHQSVRTCRTCGSECHTLTRLPEARGLKVTSFYAALPQAFTYPFKADGLVLLTAGTVFYLILHYATFLSSVAGLIGLAATIILTVGGGGFLFAYMKSIITTTAEGSDALPDWPDVGEWTEDLAVPFGQMISTVIFSFLPVVGLFVAALGGVEIATWMWILAALGCCAYYPMGLLSVAVHNTIAGLNPLLVVISICRVAVAYTVCCTVLAAVFVVRALVVEYLPTILPVPFLPTLIAGFIGLYLLTVLMRILGLLYLAKENELGWFKR